MIKIACPDCRRRLALRLDPGEPSAARCLACGGSVDYGYLIRSGIPSGLIVRLMEWATHSEQVLGSGTGASEADDDYVRAWKELHDRTEDLISRLGWYVKTRADVVTEVFATRSRWAWTDAEILRWRARRQRLDLISNYSFALAWRRLRNSSTSSALPEPLSIDFPAWLCAEEERAAFRDGLDFAAILAEEIHGNFDAIYDLADLERRLGIPSASAG